MKGGDCVENKMKTRQYKGEGRRDGKVMLGEEVTRGWKG